MSGRRTGAAGGASGRAAGDRRRDFPPLEPRRGSRAPFAESWWGRAWIDALERTSLNTGRLSRGRTYARGGHVLDIAVTPGRITAQVQGSRSRPYRAEVRLRTFTEEQWDRFLATAAGQAGHLAALLDKDMPQTLADSADRAGVRLLPGPGDLEPHCSCPDTGRPCKHAAALCYQAARLLDVDPFVLLLLRGRGEAELLADLGRRNALAGAREALAAEPGTPVAQVLHAAALRPLPPLPPPLAPPPAPGQGPALPDAPAAVDAPTLELLAADTAARAHARLTRGAARGEPGGEPDGALPQGAGPAAPTPWQDAVRLAATLPTAGVTSAGRRLHARLAAATDRTPAQVGRAVAAWRQGGAEGLRMLEEPWDPPAGPFDRARPALAAADLPPLRPYRNRLTDEARGLQLRYGRDKRWYPYTADPGSTDFWPAGPPDPDPVGALTALLAATV
ncbi:SWIM zinc finger family protein [Streptomyces polyrhachis]|uniref:SWIM zinc finger family protein n=1 Tax=Streptomyces polyrhachis TaxID=1282885 RepID=A0ABW2G9F2_9ACTN